MAMWFLGRQGTSWASLPPAPFALAGWAGLVSVAGLDCPAILILLGWAKLVELVELAGPGWSG